jgi:hypothetical protein
MRNQKKLQTIHMFLDVVSNTGGANPTHVHTFKVLL